MPPVDTDSSTKLANILREEVALLRTFIGVLKTEQEALVKSELDRLLPLASEKSNLTLSLANLTEQRGHLLAAASLSPDRAGMEAWLGRMGSTPGEAVKVEWMNLLSLAAEARALNQANGVVIGTRLQHNQQALSVLLSACDKASLYGPDGQTKTQGGGRFFGSA